MNKYCMEHTSIKKVFIVYLKFRLWWMFYILYGNPTLGRRHSHKLTDWGKSKRVGHSFQRSLGTNCLLLPSWTWLIYVLRVLFEYLEIKIIIYYKTMLPLEWSSNYGIDCAIGEDMMFCHQVYVTVPGHCSLPQWAGHKACDDGPLSHCASSPDLCHPTGS